MKHRNPLRQGEWLVCPLNSAGRELAVRETKEFYSWENLLCCAELPDLFLWKSPFLRKQNTLMLPNCPKGFCICQRKHGNQLQQRLCQTNPLSCCVFSLFLSFPSWHFLNSLACHAEVTYSIAPSPNLRTQSHLQHSCSNTKPAHGEAQRAETQSLAVLAKSGTFDKRCLEKSRRYKGPEQNCVASIHSTNNSAISQWPCT